MNTDMRKLFKSAEIIYRLSFNRSKLIDSACGDGNYAVLARCELCSTVSRFCICCIADSRATENELTPHGREQGYFPTRRYTPSAIVMDMVQLAVEPTFIGPLA